MIQSTTLRNLLAAEEERFVAGVQAVSGECHVPWNVQQLGNRAEYWLRPAPARTGGAAALFG